MIPILFGMAFTLQPMEIANWKMDAMVLEVRIKANLSRPHLPSPAAASEFRANFARLEELRKKIADAEGR